jgi:transcription-repair coupling factor (superfamily II helicase)
MKSTLPETIGRLLAAPNLVELAHTIEASGAASVSGLWGSSTAAVVAALRRHTDRPVLLVCGHLDEADDLADDIELFGEPRPEVLPALELGGGLGQVSEEQASNRLRLINRLAVKDKALTTIVAPIQGLMQSVPSRDELGQLTRTVGKGEMLEPEKLIVWLSEHGYNRLDQVEVPGDFAVRGGIIDVYIPGDANIEGSSVEQEQVGLTVRIDFFGDQVESIKQFDLDSLG